MLYLSIEKADIELKELYIWSSYKDYINKLGGNIEKYSKGGILINSTSNFINSSICI